MSANPRPERKPRQTKRHTERKKNAETKKKDKNGSVGVLRADLLDRIGQNTPSFFEQLIVDLLIAMGYGGSRKNAASQLGSRGMEAWTASDRLGFDGMFANRCRAPDALCGGPRTLLVGLAREGSS